MNLPPSVNIWPMSGNCMRWSRITELASNQSRYGFLSLFARDISSNGNHGLWKSVTGSRGAPGAIYFLTMV